MTTPPSDAPALPLFTEPTPIVDPDEGDARFWSVTTIIGALDKPALVPWAALETAKAAVKNWSTWRSIQESDGDAEAINYLKGARFRRGPGQRSATDLGTAVHRALHHKALHGRYREEDKADPELVPYLVQANRFLADFRPRYEATEMTVFSPTYGYAGTLDAIAVIDGVTAVIDYKTSSEAFDSQGKPKGPYPEVALQLAAYRYADLAALWHAREAKVGGRRYYLLSEAERAMAVDMPEVDHGMAVFLTPTDYSVHPVRCDDEIHEYFLHVLDAARFVFEVGKTVIGSPLIPPSALAESVGDPFASLPK